MIIQEREKNILAILSVAIVICTYWYGLKPSLEQAGIFQSEVNRLEEELRHPRITPEKLKELEEGISAVQTEISTLSAQIPASEDRGFLIRDLERLARKNNIEIISFIPKEAVPVTMGGKEITKRMKRSKKQLQDLEEFHAKVLKTVISIDSHGSFENYNKFFDDVLTYYKAVEISDLVIAKGSSAGMGDDKRFAKKTSKDPVADARNASLNVSFTLLAYTGV